MGYLRKSLIFSVLRYLEYGIIALSYIVIAKKVGPAEYSKTIPGFIFITYSQYLMMGLNGALIKAYVVDSTFEIKQIYVKNTLYFAFFISFVAFILGVISLPKQLFVVSLISSMVYFQNVFQTLLRLEDKILGINFSNLVFSVIYFVLVFFYAKNVQLFFLYWLFSLVISNLLNAIQAYPILKKLQLRFHKKDILQVIKTIKPQIKLGTKMTLMGIVSTYFLTFDRFLLNNFSANKSLKGNYQLADNIASTIYLFFVTVVFYYTPAILKKASLSPVFRVQMLRFGTAFVLILSVLAIGITPLIDKFIIIKYFPAYAELTHFLTYQFILKIIILSIGIAGNISIALNSEVKFLKWWFLAISIAGTLLFVFYKFAALKTEEIITLALIFQFTAIIISNAFYLWANRKAFFALSADKELNDSLPE